VREEGRTGGLGQGYNKKLGGGERLPVKIITRVGEKKKRARPYSPIGYSALRAVEVPSGIPQGGGWSLPEPATVVLIQYFRRHKHSSDIFLALSVAEHESKRRVTVFLNLPKKKRNRTEKGDLERNSGNRRLKKDQDAAKRGKLRESIAQTVPVRRKGEAISTMVQIRPQKKKEKENRTIVKPRFADTGSSKAKGNCGAGNLETCVKGRKR